MVTLHIFNRIGKMVGENVTPAIFDLVKDTLCTIKYRMILSSRQFSPHLLEEQPKAILKTLANNFRNRVEIGREKADNFIVSQGDELTNVAPCLYNENDVTKSDLTFDV